MRDLLIAIGCLLGGILKITLKLVVATVKAIRPKASNRPQQPRPASVAVAPQDNLAAEVPDTVFHTGTYDVADRIVSIRLDPPVGVINLRIYNAQKIVKRDLIINEPRLKAMMRGRRHTFAEASFDAIQGLDAIKDDSVNLAESLINALGKVSVRQAKPVNPVTVSKPVPVQEATVKPSPPQAIAVPSHGTEAPEVASQVFATRPLKGTTYVGTLIRAQTETMRPKGRSPYETFQALLRLDNGVELPLRGAELERELTASQCQLGQRIAITPMGKVPVELAGGGEGSKNLYRVKNMTTAGGLKA
jgi:hypothetical protein